MLPRNWPDWAGAAALSGLFRGSILNASVLAVAAGMGMAALDAVSVDSGSDTVRHAIELALILTLFSDGLFVERRHAHPRRHGEDGRVQDAPPEQAGQGGGRRDERAEHQEGLREIEAHRRVLILTAGRV